ncbi:hypothetical protein [Marisediminicola sp. LYQ134]|uniref:hypothetical protein n=1 Tax=unclassified Marisediminicola TaxID=2618316 RepID=UPI003983B84B
MSTPTPKSDDAAKDAAERRAAAKRDEKQAKKAEISPRRIALWVAVGGIGLYFLGTGIWGILTG